MKRKLKNLVLAACLLFMALPVFALEEYVSLVYKEIDVAFADRSDVTLDEILQRYQGDTYYFLMENYSMKKVRRLILINDYEFALDADLVIIDNNLDNIEAVELYATITDAYEMQKAVQRLAEEKQKAEEQRLVVLKEEQRDNVAKKYNTVKTSDGNVVYTTGKNGGQFSYSGWNFDIGLAPGFISNSATGLNSISVGLGMDIGYYRILNNTNLGGDVSGTFKFLNESVSTQKDNSIFFDGSLMFKIAFHDFTDKLFLRAGVDIEGCIQGNAATTVYDRDLQSTLFSPAIGIKLVDISLGNMAFAMSTDYLMAHLWTDNLKFAMRLDSTLSIPFATMEKVDLNFIVGLKDVMFMKDSGFENRMNLVFALGGRNVR
ncbi:MAG: hypothetical protein MJ182_07670 [Treponema sp.]|nr:hypothetical protein [Treponema sp.]